jgi:ribosomal protein S27AE
VTVGRSCIKVVWKERHINRPAGLLLADHEEDRVNCGWLEPL